MPSRNVSPPTIRQYRQGDDPHVWALVAYTIQEGADDDRSQPPLPLPPASEPPPDSPDLADIGKVFLLSGGDFLVAEIFGMVVGTAGLRLVDDGVADVVRVAVHPAVRRRGVGTALLETTERRAEGLGIQRLKLDVGNNHRAAISFYLASGFKSLDDGAESDQKWDVNYFSKSLRHSS